MIPHISFYAYESQADYHWKFFFEKPNRQKPKNVIFQLRQFSIFFHKNIRNVFLAEKDILMCLNLFGYLAVGHKLKKGVKTQKINFYPFFEITLDSLITIQVALCINLSYSPKDQSQNFFLKNIKNWWSWKIIFFLFFCFFGYWVFKIYFF